MVDVNITGGRIKSPSKIIFEAGIWCQLKLSKVWTAQVEAIYIEKGTGGFSHKRPPLIGEYAVVLYYLEVPLLFQYHIKKFTFEAGLGLGVLVGEFENLFGASLPDMTNSYPFTKKEFSFNFGVGYSFNEKWYLGLRFTHSLLPVRKQLPDISKPVYNRVFALTVSRQLMTRKQKKKETQAQE